jgi:hypothetical protein
MTANSLASKTAQGEEHFDFLFAIWLILNQHSASPV